MREQVVAAVGSGKSGQLVSETVRKHREFLYPNVYTFYDEPVALDHGEGMYVWDESDNRYLDCFGGVLTVSVGHANPTVVEAIVSQVKRLQHTSALYPHRAQSDLAEKLASISPGRLQKCFFTSSGTEANDTAILTAQIHTGRQELVTLRHSYSGRSATAQSAVGHSPWRAVPAQVAGITHALAPYCYRCPLKLTYPNCNLACADDIENVIQTTTTGQISAFMAETILGVGGFIVPPPGYFERAVEIARNYGGLFISDEVQTAWGRTGDKWFGIEHWDVKPDILTSAKGMANGTPIGLTIATREVADSFTGLTFATFGGNPVSTAAALATISVIESDDLRANARDVGAYLRQGMESLKETHEIIGDVRGLGLMQGIELVKDRKSKEPNPQALLAILEETKKRGVLIGKGGLYGSVIRAGMPLIAKRQHVDVLIDALDAAFGAVGNQ